jgi:DNA-binding CsgD family transcriptional regulator
VESLKTKDLRAILDFLQGCYATRDLDDFVAEALANLPKLIRADATVYNEYNPRRNRIIWLQDPVDFAFRGSEKVWERHSNEHPFIDHYRKSRHGGAVKFSDFVSARQFRRTALYNEFFRPLNINHQLGCLLEDPETVWSGFSLNRGTHDFTERDRLILNLLRPHLLQAYRNAEALALLQRNVARLNGALEQLDKGIVILSRGEKVQAMTERARRWLCDYFGAHAAAGDRLPDELRRWVKEQTAALGRRGNIPLIQKPSVIQRDARQLSIRLIPDADQMLLILHERRTDLEISTLERLGLSNREAEVLSWIAQGKTNREIARIIGSSPRTIEKHVEKILEKLSVETRTAAAAIALRLAESSDQD